MGALFSVNVNDEETYKTREEIRFSCAVYQSLLARTKGTTKNRWEIGKKSQKPYDSGVCTGEIPSRFQSILAQELSELSTLLMKCYTEQRARKQVEIWEKNYER